MRILSVLWEFLQTNPRGPWFVYLVNIILTWHQLAPHLFGPKSHRLSGILGGGPKEETQLPSSAWIADQSQLKLNRSENNFNSEVTKSLITWKRRGTHANWLMPDHFSGFVWLTIPWKIQGTYLSSFFFSNWPHHQALQQSLLLFWTNILVRFTALQWTIRLFAHKPVINRKHQWCPSPRISDYSTSSWGFSHYTVRVHQHCLELLE